MLIIVTEDVLLLSGLNLAASRSINEVTTSGRGIPSARQLGDCEINPFRRRVLVQLRHEPVHLIDMKFGVPVDVPPHLFQVFHGDFADLVERMHDLVVVCLAAEDIPPHYFCTSERTSLKELPVVSVDV